MTYYAIIECNISSPEWVPDYLTHVPTLIETFGGKYISKTAKIELIEGEESSTPQFSLIAEFPSKQAFHEFYECDTYQPFKTARINGSKTRLLLTSDK